MATINELAALSGEDLDLFLECLFHGMTEATLQQLAAHEGRPEAKMGA